VKEDAFFVQINNLESINGNPDYMDSPFLSAGERMYVVGHQNGTFPDLGWHIKDEMGGVWLPPIKLMDGYSLSIKKDTQQICLNEAVNFENYPVGASQNFNLDELGIAIRQFHFVPEEEKGVIIALKLQNNSSEANNFQLNIHNAVDLLPVWLSDSLQLKNGKDKGKWIMKPGVYTAKDESNKWFVAFGGKGFKPSMNNQLCDSESNGLGFNQTLSKPIKLKANESQVIFYAIAGSYESRGEALNIHKKLLKNRLQLLEEKIIAYQNIKNFNALNTNDEGFNQMYTWLKYNSKWLMQTVPELGTGITAGSPDYPWWFGTDNGYAVQGLLAAGMHKEALQSIALTLKLSQKANGDTGRIMHEVSTNGVIFNPGNLNTTPKFVSLLWKAYAWTADSKILDYYEFIKKAVKWVEQQDKDQNGYPDGAGMMEIHGLDSEMIDVVSYQYEMYIAAANFAKVKNDMVLANEYNQKAISLKERINSDWWVEEFKSYADFRSSKEKAIQLTEDAIIRADSIQKPWSVEELENTLVQIKADQNEGNSPYVVFHNWIVNTPMEVGASDPDKSEKALKSAEKYSNRFGMFVTGIDRDEKQEKASKWKSFSYVGAVMTLPTGVQAIAEAKYGKADKSLEYLKKLENSFSYALAGSMYEVSPDFGMMTQAWNIYAVAVPVVEEYFGIKPAAWKNEITIKPNLPSSWDDVSLNQIKVGNNLIDIQVKRIDKTLEFKISQLHNWKINFEYAEAKSISFDGNKTVKEKIELFDRVHHIKVEM